MNNPSVSILLPSLGLGGAEKALVELANGLASHEWPVRILTMNDHRPLANSVSPLVEIVNLDCATYRRAVFALARHYKEARPDIVLTSMYATGLAAVAARAFSSVKPKIIIGAHNSLRAKVKRPDNVKDKYLLLPLCRLLFRRADAVVAVSRGLGAELQAMLKLPNEKVHVIYNPVISPQFLIQAAEPVDHRWLNGMPARQFKTLITVGRLVEQKGFDVLLKAVGRVKQERDVRLIIIGEGPLRGELEALARLLDLEASVEFAGLQKNPYAFMSKADLFVLSSRWEGLSNVLIEALACGCPVVATNCNYGPEEILQGEAYGILAPVEDPEGLAACILQALLSTNPDHDDGEKLRARAHDFTVEKSVAAYIELFRELAPG